VAPKTHFLNAVVCKERSSSRLLASVPGILVALTAELSLVIGHAMQLGKRCFMWTKVLNTLFFISAETRVADENSRDEQNNPDTSESDASSNRPFPESHSMLLGFEMDGLFHPDHECPYSADRSIPLTGNNFMQPDGSALEHNFFQQVNLLTKTKFCLHNL
jgi:hypothetical protein